MKFVTLRLYHIYKVWCRGTDEDLIEYSKACEWFTNCSTSELVMVCKGGHLRNTMRGRSRLNLQSFYLFLYYR